MTLLLLALALWFTATGLIAVRIGAVVAMLVSAVGALAFWSAFGYAVGYTASRGLIGAALEIGAAFAAITVALLALSLLATRLLREERE